MAQTVEKLPGPGEEWNEAQMEQALKRLKELHLALRKLRFTVPEMLEPLGVPHPSVQSRNAAILGAAKTAHNQVAEFKRLHADNENRNIIERAKQSRKENPSGITPWSSVHDPDWTFGSTD